jgi:hypothetical protein
MSNADSEGGGTSFRKSSDVPGTWDSGKWEEAVGMWVLFKSKSKCVNISCVLSRVVLTSVGEVCDRGESRINTSCHLADLHCLRFSTFVINALHISDLKI